MNPEFVDLAVLLAWIVAGGSVILAGMAFAYLAENWPAWNNLPKPVKVITPLIVAIVLSIGSTLLLQQKELLTQVQPWWAVIFQTLLAYVASQKAYLGIKSAKAPQPMILPYRE